MSVALTLNTSTNVALTPQLQKAIRLLQLSSIELQQEISTILETNPFLEMDLDNQYDQTSSEHGEDFDDYSDQDNYSDSQINASTELTEENLTANISEDLPVELNWEDTYQDYAKDTKYEEDPDYNFERKSSEESLTDKLLWDLKIQAKDMVEYRVGEAIIDYIDEDGYFRETTKSIYEIFKYDFEDLSLSKVEEILKLVQSIAPKAGIGARDLKECLKLQLEDMPPATPFLQEALHLVEKYLENLASNDTNILLKRLHISKNELDKVKKLIKSLDPKPGLEYGGTELEYIIPDLIVKLKKSNNSKTASDEQDLAWKISLNRDITPKLRINNFYVNMAKQQGNSETGKYLKENHKEAKWFIDSIENRKSTLLRVGIEIVKRQQEFLAKGEEYMKPMVLADIAEAIGMHESTVSRATNSKYINTPMGTYELKFFFSSHVSTDEGNVSATAIRAKIKKLIDGENKTKPLSDHKIVEFLSKDGIPIARRTVAKYREAMNIPSSSSRKLGIR